MMNCFSIKEGKRAVASTLTKRPFYPYASSNQFSIDFSFPDLEIKRFNINLCVKITFF